MIIIMIRIMIRIIMIMIKTCRGVGGKELDTLHYTLFV